MVKYKEKKDRSQISFLPDCVEDYIDEENPVRVIDAFVDSLDMETLGFLKAKPAQTGRPAYDPRDLLKLYLYGYLNRIRSSRMLMRECRRNITLCRACRVLSKNGEKTKERKSDEYVFLCSNGVNRFLGAVGGQDKTKSVLLDTFCDMLVLDPKGDTIKEDKMLSQNYKYWASIEDLHRCIDCARLHGQIYTMEEIPLPNPPLHDNCRCSIEIMEALLVGTATSKGKNGADWWIAAYNQLPPYYISEDEARALGWKAWNGNLAAVAPNRMLAKGVYRNDDGHLPYAPGRVWYEADINYTSGWRGSERILYSNDGLVFVTRDHYHTFIEIVSPTLTKIDS